MYKHRLIYVAVFAALTVGAKAAAAGNGTVVAPNGNRQMATITVQPSRLPKSEPAPVKVQFAVEGSNPGRPGGVPVPATHVALRLDRDISVFAKGIPTCKPATVQNLTTEAAMKACGPAKIGGGTVEAMAALSGETLHAPGRLTVFNGPPEHGHPVLVLHAYVTRPTQLTLVLTGAVDNYRKQGYGSQIEFSIPPLLGGAGALTEVSATIAKHYTYEGKKRSYFNAFCRSGRLKTQAGFEYSDGESLTTTTSSSCIGKN